MPYVIRKLPNKELYKVYTVEIQDGKKKYVPHSKEGLDRKTAEKQKIALNIAKKEKKEKKCKCHQEGGFIPPSGVRPTFGGFIPLLPVLKYGSRLLTRNSPTTSFKKFLNNKGDIPITKIYFGRIPIQKAIKGLIDVLSLGRSYFQRKKLNYDDYYHNYLIFELSNGEKWVIEKNQVVAYSKPTQKQLNNILYEWIPNQNNTLNKIFQNGMKNTKNFWLYNADGNNCQVFVANLLQKNGYTIEGKEEILPQKSKEIINTLPYALRSIPEIVTNIASIGTKLLD